MSTNTTVKAASDKREGVWKSGKGRGRHQPKGRQLDDAALNDVQALLGSPERRADLLIELLHLRLDKYGHPTAHHLHALAEELKLSQAEVYEVASFYAHFDIVAEGETPPPALTIRVCDSLSCELAVAQQRPRHAWQPDVRRRHRSGWHAGCLPLPNRRLGRFRR